MISEDWQSYFGARQCRGGMLWKSQKFQGGQIALMDSMKTVIKASEHLSLNTHVTNLSISHSSNDVIYLLCFGPILIFIQTRPFVILTTFIKVSFIRPRWRQSKLQMTIAVRSWHCYHFKWAKWERLWIAESWLLKREASKRSLYTQSGRDARLRQSLRVTHTPPSVTLKQRETEALGEPLWG